MDVFDLILQRDVGQLRDEVERLRRDGDLTGWDARKVKELAEENLQLKVRLGLLVRLLVAKGVFSAEEFAALLAQARREAQAGVGIGLP